jgi:hypothetical protein
VLRRSASSAWLVDRGPQRIVLVIEAAPPRSCTQAFRRATLSSRWLVWGTSLGYVGACPAYVTRLCSLNPQGLFELTSSHASSPSSNRRVVCSLAKPDAAPFIPIPVLLLPFACASRPRICASCSYSCSYSCIERVSQTSNTAPCHLPSSNSPRFRLSSATFEAPCISLLLSHSPSSKKPNDEVLDALHRQSGVVGRCGQACATRGKRNSWLSRDWKRSLSRAGLPFLRIVTLLSMLLTLLEPKCCWPRHPAQKCRQPCSARPVTKAGRNRTTDARQSRNPLLRKRKHRHAGAKLPTTH